VHFLADTSNLILIAMAIASGSLLLWPLLRDRAAGPSVTTLAATQMINARQAQLVDVRKADEFASGSVPNARNIPFEQMGKPPGELRKDRPVILVCERGSVAGRAASKLRAAGWNEVYVLAGGLGAWRDAGLPIRK
jgi:rhodanese-related sulfurtransferase